MARMSSIRHLVHGTVVSVCVTTVLCVGVVTPASARTGPRSGPTAVVEIEAPDGVTDSGAATASIYVISLRRGHPVGIDFGDGITTTVSSSCSAKRAKSKPEYCHAQSAHHYSTTGQYTITATQDGRVLSTITFTLAPTPGRWNKTEDWIQPTGWLPRWDTAGFNACSTVTWGYDPTNAVSNAAQTEADIVHALEILSRETGLTFTKVSEPTNADLWVMWEPIGSLGSEQNGRISLTNKYDRLHDGDQQRLWVIVHEVMHRLGFDHVNVRGETMQPNAIPRQLGPGDLDGLHTMYLNVPCFV